MPIYIYKARDDEGRLINGRLEASGEEALQVKLQNMGFLLTQFSLERKNFLKEDVIARLLPITPKDKYTLTLQLANTIEAGVPIMTALNSIIQECGNKKLAKALEGIRADLKSGVSFSEALRKHRDVFSEFYASMVELGESSGNLAHVLYEIAEYIKREMEVRHKIISTITYPVILACVATGIMAYLLTFIMPQFVEIFIEEGVALPLPTQILLILSKLLTHYWYIILAALAGLILGFRALSLNAYGRLKLDQIKLKLPLFGGLFKKLYIYQFTEALTLLYNSGLPIIGALRIIEQVVQNKVMENIVKTLSAHLAKGEELVEYLRLVNFFPSEVLAMIKVGEEGGRLGAVLAKVSEIYREEMKYTVERLVSILEPAVIIFMGLGVGFLAISVIFPLFKLSRIAAGGA